MQLKSQMHAVACTLLLGCAHADPPTAAHETGPFTNPHVDAPHGGFFRYVGMRLFGGHEWASYDPKRDGPIPRAEPDLARPRAPTGNAAVTWIGHSTVLIQHQGVNVLTDPILSEYASPVPFAGPKRRSPAALDFDALPRIDVVMISHDHYDHLDAPTIRALGNEPHYFVPLGLATWLEDHGIEGDRVTEMNWWDRAELDVNGTPVAFTATPSQHFSGRSLTDRNRTLWAGWALHWDDFALWFGGDTGYNDVQFADIGERLGPFDLGIIPIGAYLPREFMRTVHVNPAEAVLIHRDIRARRSMGVHWGTFELSAEHLLEPARALADAVTQAGLSREAFTTFAIGETRSFDADPEHPRQ